MYMYIYNYKKDTGEFLGVSLSDPNPLDPETPLIPAYATTVEPPKPGPGQIAVFVEGAWSVVEDHRGKSVYDKTSGKPITIRSLGALPDTVTEQAPPSAAHTWSGSGWELDREKYLAMFVRPRRNQLLNEADIVHCNAERWEEMTSEQKAAWRNYKTALRELPDTIDPADPVWPESPAVTS